MNLTAHYIATGTLLKRVFEIFITLLLIAVYILLSPEVHNMLKHAITYVFNI